MKRTRRRVAIAALLIPLLLLLGCDPIERQAYNTVVVSKAFLDTVRTAHPECATVENTAALCGLIRRAVGAKDFIIDAGEVYCNVAQFDAAAPEGQLPCTPPAKGTPIHQQLLDRLNSALAVYSLAERDLRAVIQ